MASNGAQNRKDLESPYRRFVITTELRSNENLNPSKQSKSLSFETLLELYIIFGFDENELKNMFSYYPVSAYLRFALSFYRDRWG